MSGSWHGISKLNLGEDPAVEEVTESDSLLRIETDPRNEFATVTYSWSYEGEEQTGSLLVAGSINSDKLTGGWADSWHQNGSVMSMNGTGTQSNCVRLTGSYGPEDQPQWGWRIELESIENQLTLRMVNISPDGDETWAVCCDYARD